VEKYLDKDIFPIKMPKRHHRNKKCKATEKPVFTFRQMERVVDLIDRQARLLTGEKVLPSDDYVYAKNEANETTYFYYDSASNTYYTTLKARYPAIDNYLLYKKDTYTDGVIGVYKYLGTARYRIYLENTNIYAKFKLDDTNPDASTITFYNIPVDDIEDMYTIGYIQQHEYFPFDYYTHNPVDYHRDHVAGEGLS
jgi:hypothetical protein